MIDLWILILVALAAFVMELIDSGFGMGYGTVLSPLLIALGYAPLVVVPSILFSQAIGGFTAAMFHHNHKTVNFKPKSTNIKKIKKGLKELGIVECFKRGFTRDFKIVITITFLGVIATIIGVFTAVNIPKLALKTYIGLLVMVIGIILLSKKTFKFSWKKLTSLGILASFNKGISGGGFGPVITGGQIMAGNGHKNSIGCTTLSEAPICIAGFLMYFFINGLSSYNLLIATSIGAFIGAPLGALLTKRISTKSLKLVLGIFITALGAYILIKLFIF